MIIRLATQHKKGFVTVYFTSMLLLIISFFTVCLGSLNNYLYFRNNLDAFYRMNNAEVLTIMRIKKAFQEYREKDEKLTYKGCTIDITYTGLKAEFVICYKGYIRERELEYDEISETVKEYH